MKGAPSIWIITHVLVFQTTQPNFVKQKTGSGEIGNFLVPIKGTRNDSVMDGESVSVLNKRHAL